VRLVGPELDQTWVAPSMSADDDARPPAPGEQLAHLRSAAAWIAEEISPVRELAAICLDVEGGVCSWISAPSADRQVVLAAIRQVGAPAAAPGEPAAAAPGFGLLPDDSIGVGSARSVQALATPEAHSATALLPAPAKAPALAPRQRMGVLSIADAPVRVLLDELDSLRIGVGAVLSFWHAAALAWDPSVPRARPGAERTKKETSDDPFEPIVVQPDAPTSAVVIVDPAGRLTWAWSKAGELLAAGVMRLRTHTFSPFPAVAADSPAPDALDLSAPNLRRLPHDDAGEAIQAAECSPGDIGRLVMDWLSWSVQIGHTPDRIVCVGPATIAGRPNAGEPAPTPASIAQTLAASWPAAAIDAAIHDDPIGATLNRLRALPMFAPSRTPGAGAAPVEDPRVSLVSLTTRPGRIDRTMHVWATVAILAAAAAVFIYTSRLGKGIDNLRTRVADVQSRRGELLQSAEHIIPALSKSPDPVGQLSGKIQEYSEQLSRLHPSKPILERILPALEILQSPEFEGLQITNITASSDVRIAINISVPESDDRTPAIIRQRLDERYGPGVWGGGWGSSSRGRRPYEFTWIEVGGNR
jgi:hypothetical protein